MQIYGIYTLQKTVLFLIDPDLYDYEIYQMAVSETGGI